MLLLRPWHNAKKKHAKSVKIGVLRLKRSAHMEKTFATCHFSIILISLKTGAMPFQIFLAHASISQL